MSLVVYTEESQGLVEDTHIHTQEPNLEVTALLIRGRTCIVSEEKAPVRTKREKL